MPCLTNVTQTVCLNAEVRVRPQITVGEVRTFCRGEAFIGNCTGTLQPYCSFNVSQSICVEVPLTFEATAEARPNGIVCGTPGIGNCGEETSCTLSQGFFATHEEVTNALITAAGGTIVLGTLDNSNNPVGLSFVVNTTNEDDVFNGNIPIPPLPATPPLQGQYRELYQQLLAAKLNVQNGATCATATDAIAAADTFLATSPVGGTTGAPALSMALEAFNTGNIPGCPDHCPMTIIV